MLNVAGIPTVDILIEAVGIVEHASHIDDVAGIPTVDILIEAVGTVEHELHIPNVAGIPSADILIEYVGTVEHAIHKSDAAGIPRADILIEGVGIVEHAIHKSDAAGIPRSDVLVEACVALEQFTHVAYFACHYFGDIIIGGDHSPQFSLIDDGIASVTDDASIATLGSLSELYRNAVAVELQALQGVGLVAASATAPSAIVIAGAVGQAQYRRKSEDGKNWPPAC